MYYSTSTNFVIIRFDLEYPGTQLFVFNYFLKNININKISREFRTVEILFISILYYLFLLLLLLLLNYYYYYSIITPSVYPWTMVFPTTCLLCTHYSSSFYQMHRLYIFSTQAGALNLTVYFYVSISCDLF